MSGHRAQRCHAALKTLLNDEVSSLGQSQDSELLVAIGHEEVRKLAKIIYTICGVGEMV